MCCLTCRCLVRSALFYLYVACLLFSTFTSFFFRGSAPPEIYTLSLHDALPISGPHPPPPAAAGSGGGGDRPPPPDRKSTRLNSSHLGISYAVFCLKKKKKKDIIQTRNMILQSSYTTPRAIIFHLIS